MDDQGLFDEDPVLSRRERLRLQRRAAHRAPARVGLRFTAAATVVLGLVVWLLISWLTSSPSASDSLPEDPTLDPDDARHAESGEDSRDVPGEGTSRDPDGDDAGPAPEDSGGSEGQGVVMVHVAGAVASPGVVELPVGARVRDAVEAAGGFDEEAAAEGLNLAAEAIDGSYIHVPTAEELEAREDAAPGPGIPPPGTAPGGGGAGGAEDTAGPVDLNRADAETLQRLPGIGPALAERIIEHRRTVGPFESLEELAGVRGIGPTILGDVEDQVTW